MNFGDVTTQFLNLMNRTDLRGNATLTNTFLQLGIQRISRELRVPAMEKSLVATIGTTYNGLIIPGDMLELIDLEYTVANDGVIILRRTNLTRAKTLAQTVGVPLEFSRQGKKWWLGPSPAAGTQVRIDYYADFSPLALSTDSNMMTTAFPDALIYSALEYACDYYNDERAKTFGSRYAQITQALQAMADGDELTADAVVAPALQYPSEENW